MKITLFNTSHNFGEEQIIKDVTIEFNQGGFYSIMGPSGAGKSTLLNIASGLLDPSVGQVMYDNVDIVKLEKENKTKFRVKNASFIFQDYSLVEYLTVKENVSFIAKLSKQAIDNNKLSEIIKSVGLEDKENSYPADLSGGQKQRVAIARSLFADAGVIFADEPTGALDISTRSSIMKLLKDSTTTHNKTVIMVTHDPEAASYSDEVNFLLDGRIQKVMKKSTAKQISDELIKLEKKVKDAKY